MKLLVTGGAGFVGSHVVEYYADQGHEVIALDNASRVSLEPKAKYNWDYLREKQGVKLVKGDIRRVEDLEGLVDVDVIVHAAAQTAVTLSVQNPRGDFGDNALGTFNVVEAARNSGSDPAIVYCSTNKVYGGNVNELVVKKNGRYGLTREKGVPEDYSIDLCEHTPYGCSKLAGDLYVQDYGHLYGLDTAVFRMSCIYGTRQFGIADQGWVSWFAIATITGKPITIYGDGNQVRDVLYVSDLVAAFDAFIQRRKKIRHDVFNMGGGPENTLSLLELLNVLEEFTGKKADVSFDDWRPSDQRAYISDISKAKEKLGWSPEVSPKEGVERLVNWIQENKEIF
ncbi:MAG: NAD-dependent epimerase/dehydratase family protein [Candidatus Hydrothermarchaeales archaeon]